MALESVKRVNEWKRIKKKYFAKRAKIAHQHKGSGFEPSWVLSVRTFYVVPLMHRCPPTTQIHAHWVNYSTTVTILPQLCVFSGMEPSLYTDDSCPVFLLQMYHRN